MHGLAARASLMGLLFLRQLGLGPQIAAAPTPTELVQFWEDPGVLEQRDLLAGPSLGIAPPDTTRSFVFVSLKKTGFSPGYDVKDADGREWSAKLGPESQTEVVASRLLWAVGYHQPSIYYVDRWTLTGGPAPGVQRGARFRPKDGPLKSDGIWSWQDNPFIASQPYRGLIVLMALLNSTDLRNDNNVIYKVKEEGASQKWYVVKDLGATFGATGVYRPVRNDVDAFEQEPLLWTDDNGQSRFAYRGLYKELFRVVSAADVKWACGLLDRLTPAQWHDAFAAGGYSQAVAARFIAALQMRLRVAEGVDESFNGGNSDYWGNKHLRRSARAATVTP